MTIQDPIADMLARIRNAQMAGRNVVNIPLSKIKVAILKILKDEGYIQGYKEERPSSDKVHSNLEVELKYFQGEPVIEKVTRISRPGRRVYRASDMLPRVNGGLGIAIISTSKGIMDDRKARKMRLGGEIICEVM